MQMKGLNYDYNLKTKNLFAQLEQTSFCCILVKEKYGDVLFHGSKNGLSEVTISGSRDNCDFGKGFYLGEIYHQALSFLFFAKL